MYKILLLLLLTPVLCYSQDKKTDSASINESVRKIDKLSQANNRSFVNDKRVVSNNVTEYWQHFDNKQFSRIIITYEVDTTVYREEYYIKDGSLIYAFEGITWHFPYSGPNEYIGWSGGFYFSREKLIYHVTLGHGKSESDDWDPEKEILQRLKKRKEELRSLK